MILLGNISQAMVTIGIAVLIAWLIHGQGRGLKVVLDYFGLVIP